MEKDKESNTKKVKTGKIEKVIVELDGKILTEDDMKKYVCVSKTVSEIVD